MIVHFRTLPGSPKLARAHLSNLSSYKCLHLLSLQEPHWPTHSSVNMPSNCHFRVSAFTLIIQFLEIFLQSWLSPSFTSDVASLRGPFRINVYSIPYVIYTIAILFASYPLSLLLSLLIFYFHFSCLCLLAKSLQLRPTLWDPMDCSLQASLPMEFFRQEYWSRLLCPPPGESPWQRYWIYITYVSCIGRWVL